MEQGEHSLSYPNSSVVEESRTSSNCICSVLWQSLACRLNQCFLWFPRSEVTVENLWRTSEFEFNWIKCFREGASCPVLCYSLVLLLSLPKSLCVASSSVHMRDICGFLMKEPKHFHNPFFLNFDLWFSTMVLIQSHSIPAHESHSAGMNNLFHKEGLDGAMVEFNFV